MERADFSFFHPLRVRWAEVDMQKVVFNGHYLLYCDVAFTEYWRGTGLPDAQQQARDGAELFMRHCALDYQAPAHFDDDLHIGVRCARIGHSSLQFRLGIFRDDTLLLEADMIYVLADPKASKGVEVPRAWRERLAQIEALPIDAG